MKIRLKYVGLMEAVLISVDKPKFHRYLKRNQWYDIDEGIARVLLKSSNFLTKKDVDFNKIKNTEILIQRKCALGDLIQLIPIVRYLKKKNNLKVSLVTSIRYIDFLSEFDVFENIYESVPKKQFAHFFILGGILEDDHSLINKEREMHRVKIYEQFFGIVPDEYVWCL